MTFEIRCHDTFMCQLLLEGFSHGNEFNLLHNDLTVASCRLENKIVFDDRVTVKMISPVAVLSNTTDKHTVYFSPDEEDFYEKLIFNAYRKWCTMFDEDELDIISLNLIKHRALRAAYQYHNRINHIHVVI